MILFQLVLMALALAFAGVWGLSVDQSPRSGRSEVWIPSAAAVAAVLLGLGAILAPLL